MLSELAALLIMTTLAIRKRERLNKLIQSGAFEGNVLRDFYEKSNRRRLWPHDLVGAAELLDRRWGDLEQLLGLHVLSSLRNSFELAETELANTEEHLALAAQRARIRPILGLAISTLSLAKLPDSVFPPGFWIILAELAIVMEDLEAYVHFRSMGLCAYKAMYEVRGLSNDIHAGNWFNFIRLVGEAGDLSMLRKLDCNRPRGGTAQDEYICDGAYLYAGDVEEYRRRAQSRFSDEEETFADFVRGKSIAIVGPVDVGLKHGAEIENYDLVMRFNFRGLGALEPSKFGSRTDFSFYIESNLPRENFDPKVSSVLNTLKYIVADYTHRADDVCFSGVETPVRRRYPAGHPFANPLFKGTHNAVQRAIADLARFDVGEMKVFNSDLFISAEYASGYRQTSSEVLCMGFTTHDPVSNFHFTRRMLECGVIAADARLTEILQMSDEQYVRELQLRYGHKGVGLPKNKGLDALPVVVIKKKIRRKVSKIWNSFKPWRGNKSRVTTFKNASLRASEAHERSILKKASAFNNGNGSSLQYNGKSAGVVRFELGERPDYIVNQARGKSFVHIGHTDQPANKNIIELARKDANIKGLVVSLANAGFTHYKCENQVSSFVFHSRIPTLWKPVIDGDLLQHDGVIYSLSLPSGDFKPERLLVVFSSIAEKLYESSIHRLFFQNFKTINKYLPPNTAVLRIADLGSVVGAFYLPTNFDPSNADRIQALIRKVRTDLGIKMSSIVLYGVSKGGTGALYHSLIGNYNSVSVDPITSDEHYIRKFKDSHFTIGTFPADKSEVFENLMSSCNVPTSSISVITSPHSPQYAYIDQIIRSSPIGHALNFFESENPRISDHPDVGPNTIHALTMLVNMAFYGLDFTQPNWRRDI